MSEKEIAADAASPEPRRRSRPMKNVAHISQYFINSVHSKRKCTLPLQKSLGSSGEEGQPVSRMVAGFSAVNCPKPTG